MKVLNSIDSEYYNEVTNSKVNCKNCDKPKGVEYIKIFKVKNYPPPSGFALGEHKFAEEFEKW